MRRHRYDVPALMDYVLQATGHAQLRYVGWVISQSLEP